MAHGLRVHVNGRLPSTRAPCLLSKSIEISFSSESVARHWTFKNRECKEKWSKIRSSHRENIDSYWFKTTWNTLLSHSLVSPRGNTPGWMDTLVHTLRWTQSKSQPLTLTLYFGFVWNRRATPYKTSHLNKNITDSDNFKCKKISQVNFWCEMVVTYANIFHVCLFKKNLNFRLDIDLFSFHQEFYFHWIISFLVQNNQNPRYNHCRLFRSLAQFGIWFYCISLSINIMLNDATAGTKCQTDTTL